MKRVKSIISILIATLVLLTAFAAFGAYAEQSDTEQESSSVVEQDSSSSSSEPEEESSSSEPEEESSSSEPEEESSSSEPEEESSSSEPEEESSSSEETESSSESSTNRKPSSSSEEEESYVQTIVDDFTGITIGLTQPNEDLEVQATIVTKDDPVYSEAYAKLLSESKDQEILYCYEVELVGVEDFEAKVTVMLPVKGDIIGRDMNVLFYDGDRVKSNTKPVSEEIGIEAYSDNDDSDSYDAQGIIKVSETLVSGRKYYFAVCEIADFVSSSGGIGLLGIAAIVVGLMALASGSLLAFLWIRYYKKGI